MREAFDNIAPDVLDEMITNYCEVILQAETLEEVAGIMLIFGKLLKSAVVQKNK